MFSGPRVRWYMYTVFLYWNTWRVRRPPKCQNSRLFLCLVARYGIKWFYQSINQSYFSYVGLYLVIHSVHLFRMLIWSHYYILHTPNHANDAMEIPEVNASPVFTENCRTRAVPLSPTSIKRRRLQSNVSQMSVNFAAWSLLCDTFGHFDTGHFDNGYFLTNRLWWFW